MHIPLSLFVCYRIIAISVSMHVDAYMHAMHTCVWICVHACMQLSVYVCRCVFVEYV